MDASKGNSTVLDSALEARYMFNLVRHRAVAETDGLAKAGVTNLDAFSVPQKTWTAFVAALDQHLAKQLGLYCNERVIRAPACQFLSRWDAAYCWVGAAQRLTLADRHAGESDLDVLMRNLAEAADPSPPDTAWFGWAVGYHAVETMTCLMAGYPATAGWHAGELHLHRVEKGFDRELSVAVMDPPK
jgi:hypothetical protein